ncbi:MAG: hypothetical protein IPP63_09415 [Chloracidobacterium sp.]|nr:hypothetical protein [Chloracidobacterium sp.]
MNLSFKYASIPTNMDELSTRFTNEIVEPWDSLNASLSEQVALKPDLSDLTRTAGKLATAFKEMLRSNGIDPKQRALISSDIALMCVIADSAKASLFASASKKELLSIAANFEADGSGKYKFLRNIMLIDHKRLGQHDFLEAAKRVGCELIELLSIKTDWTPTIIESTTGFEDKVVLRSPTHSGTPVNLQFLKRNDDGELVKFQPGSWQFDLLPPL